MSSFLFRRSAATSLGMARSFSTTSQRSLAHLTIVGNMGQAPELHTTSSGREIVRYVLASNSGSRDNRITSWFRITSFAEGPRRDYLLSLPKGTQVFVEGDATMNQYEDQDGGQRSVLNVVQRHIEVLRRPQGHDQPHEQT